MKDYTPQAGDLIVCPGFFARFQTAPGEAPSYAGHIAGFIAPDLVLHALWRVRTDTWEKFRNEHPKGFKVYRYRGISEVQTRQIAAQALEFSAKGYGWWRLLAHGADYGASWFLQLFGRKGELYFFRRALSNGTRWPLCHELWARAYAAVLGLEFGKPWHLVNPDQMHDWITAHPYQWEMIHERPAS